MKRIDIVVGTVTGTALSISKYLKKQFDTRLNIQMHEYPDLDEILSKESSVLLFCISNTGVGELPPSLQKMYFQLTTQDRDLSKVQYLIINLGDSSFKSFAKSGETLNKALQACGAKPLDERLIIDAMTDRYPRQTALDWLQPILLKHGLFTAP